ncbi:SurA N-terminal domain-containing protein [Caldimonas sp. KR1-144]|uniref:SurA N-terminal domain-containing protein n=1 Tax=Caldimonas sp. KR1-144 TaxID=3400911 RepID=UPI003C09562F
MFDFVRKHTRLMQLLLVLLIFPSFVFFGIQGYSGFKEGRQEVAKVAGQSITQTEWDEAHRRQVERMRAQAPGVDLKLFDTPEMKQRTLDELVRERVMMVAADKLRLTTGDQRLARLFQNDPQFAVLRNPDGTLNKALIEAQGMSVAQFEQQLRRDLAMRQVVLGVLGSATPSAEATELATNALFQRREVRVARFDAKAYEAQVKPTDADLQAYYDDAAHAATFESPEQASVEYIVLDLEAVKKGITVSDAELKAYYEQNAARFTAPEERRASHILVKAEASAPAAEREKAKAKAESLLAELKRDPKQFAELAKKNSDDPGSAQRGGDLEWFGRGAMVKPFEDAAFALKPGELSGVVQSDFGYHVIQVTGARGGERKPFEQVQAEVRNEVLQQAAQRRYAEAAETFSNLVYEQSDSLKPAADKLQLTVLTATGVTRTPKAGAAGPLSNAKLLESLFSAEALRDKRNTEAVEVGPNQLASARIVSYQPKRKLPFDEVKDRVRGLVTAQQAAALARKEGEAKLAAWKQGGEPALDAAVEISRVQPKGLPREAIDALMKAPVQTLPAWTGIDLGAQGYLVARIDKVLPRDPASGDAKQLQGQFAQAWSQAESLAYYESLKQRLRVHVEAKAPAAAASAAQ